VAITKEKKSEILEKLKKVVKDSVSIVLVNFHGMPVKETREVRKALKEKGVDFLVAKKTLAKKALASALITGSMPETPGELGLVYGSDRSINSLDPAREVYVFQKKLDKKIQIVGGVFEGRFMNQAEMTSLANIPGLQTLHAQFVNLINSPIAGFVMIMNGIADKRV
jgi:large subunit ribosomal protein L10